MVVNVLARNAAADSTRAVLQTALEGGWVSKHGCVPSGLPCGVNFETRLAADREAGGGAAGAPRAQLYAQEMMKLSIKRFAVSMANMEPEESDALARGQLRGFRATADDIRAETACFYARVLAPEATGAASASSSPTSRLPADLTLDGDGDLACILMDEEPEPTVGDKRASPAPQPRKVTKVSDGDSPC